MGWFSFGKAYEAGKKAYNTGKNIADKAGKLYDKAKEMYSKGKELVSNLPVVGGVASELFGKGEEFLKRKLEEKTGLTAEDIDSKIQEARSMVANLPG
jgi:hypothetical protein